MALVAVDLPIEWLAAADGRRRVAVEGRTVGECLASLAARLPRVGDRLGGRYEVFVNLENVRYRQGGGTPVGPADVVQIVPARI